MLTSRIGLIGGASWASTTEYYRRLNALAQQLGGQHTSSDVALISLNFQHLLACQQRGDENGEFSILLRAAMDLAKVGAKDILICSNTTSRTCDRLQQKIGVRIVNIIDATAENILNRGFNRVGLVATRYVMEQEFYKSRLKHFGIELVTPCLEVRNQIHEVIYRDLCHNNITSEARRKIVHAMDSLLETYPIEAIVLGCTEIPLLFPDETYYRTTPLVDSIGAHIDALGRLREDDLKASK